MAALDWPARPTSSHGTPRPSCGSTAATGTWPRAEVEAHTDRMADLAWDAIGPQRCAQLLRLMAPLVGAIVSGDDFLPGNPMGLRPLCRRPVSAPGECAG